MTEKTNEIVHSPLWHKIFAIIRQIPMKAVTDDAVDYYSASTMIEQLIPPPRVTDEEIEDTFNGSFDYPIELPDGRTILCMTKSRFLVVVRDLLTK